MKTFVVGLMFSGCMLLIGQAHADGIPASFDSAGEDRKAIEKLLDTYTRAISGKDQALFE